MTLVMAPFYASNVAWKMRPCAVVHRSNPLRAQQNVYSTPPPQKKIQTWAALAFWIFTLASYKSYWKVDLVRVDDQAGRKIHNFLFFLKTKMVTVQEQTKNRSVLQSLSRRPCSKMPTSSFILPSLRSIWGFFTVILKLIYHLTNITLPCRGIGLF